MAKAKSKEESNTTENEQTGETEEVVESAGLPEGFVSIQAQECDGWAKIEQGIKIQGTFRGKFQGRGQKGEVKHFYQIELTQRAPISVRNEDGNGWVDSMGDIGAIVNMNASPGLRDLDTLIDDDAHTWEVCIVPRGKRPLRGGKSMWLFDVGKREAPVPF